MRKPTLPRLLTLGGSALAGLLMVASPATAEPAPDITDAAFDAVYQGVIVDPTADIRTADVFIDGNDLVFAFTTTAGSPQHYGWSVDVGGTTLNIIQPSNEPVLHQGSGPFGSNHAISGRREGSIDEVVVRFDLDDVRSLTDDLDLPMIEEGQVLTNVRVRTENHITGLGFARDSAGGFGVDAVV